MEYEEHLNPLAQQDLADEPQIRFALIEFFEIASKMKEENLERVMEEMKAKRNAIISMMRIYLAKFNNQPIIQEFNRQLIDTKDKATDRYLQYMKEMETVGINLGIREDLADKIAEQFYEQMRQYEQMKTLETKNIGGEKPEFINEPYDSDR